MPLAIRRSRSLEAEEVVNEGSLPGDVILSQPPDLSLTNHVHRFRFPEVFGSRVEGPESLTRSDPPLAVDLGRTPERVLATHSPNKLAYFLRRGWSSTLTMVQRARRVVSAWSTNSRLAGLCGVSTAGVLWAKQHECCTQGLFSFDVTVFRTLTAANASKTPILRLQHLVYDNGGGTTPLAEALLTL
jgi:hypothetical protein